MPLIAKPAGRRITLAYCLAAGILILSLFLVYRPVKAAGPQDDLARINTSLDKALVAAKSGDLATAQQEYKNFDKAWFDIEDGVREQSRDTYKAIENKMKDVVFALGDTPVDNNKVIAALEALKATNQLFINSAAPANNSAPNSQNSSVTNLLGLINEARDYQAKGDYVSAAKEIKEFQDKWLDVEGLVKAKSASAYTETENDMALAYQLLSNNAAEAKAVLDRMYNRLEPFQDANSYGILDAMMILVREGLEALLVVAALLAFLKKSGNEKKSGWIWTGVGAGLALSVVLALVMQFLFSQAITPENREIIEGATGLVAAAMLLYVSYWMHSKSSAKAWMTYIRQKTNSALARGSLFGLAFLAFLAIFREGAETALFYLGIGPSISGTDLLIGIGTGLALLVVLGFLMIFAGMKVPVGPFFTIAGLLVFYLCFKFVGTGIHNLQVGGLVPSSSASYLPASDFFGIFPTWETTLPQLILLAIGVGVVVYGRIKNTQTARLVAAKSN